MKFVIQRVKGASVCVGGKVVGKIDRGFLVLIGVSVDDVKENADYLVNKTVNLRVFEDENDKMNLGLNDVNGEILAVSQFTLYADCRKGNRPSFVDAAKSEDAEEMYNYVVNEFSKKVKNVQTGLFGADMQVSLINDGPVTIILEK